MCKYNTCLLFSQYMFQYAYVIKCLFKHYVQTPTNTNEIRQYIKIMLKLISILVWSSAWPVDCGLRSFDKRYPPQSGSHEHLWTKARDSLMSLTYSLWTPEHKRTLTRLQNVASIFWKWNRCLKNKEGMSLDFIETVTLKKCTGSNSDLHVS